MLLIASACVLVWIRMALLSPDAREAFIDMWGLTPAYLTHAPDRHEALTVLSGLFVHNTVGSLAITLLLLMFAAPAVQRVVGTVGFALAYMLVGIGVGLAQTAIDPEGIVPLVGGTGAALVLLLAAPLAALFTGRAAARLPAREPPPAPYDGTASAAPR